MKLKQIAPAMALIVGFAVIAGATAAKPSLRDVDHVREGLISAGIAVELADKCNGLSVRMLRGIGFLQDLKSHAASLGYSEAEIEAYVDDEAEKARLIGIARQRLAELGAVEGDPATYCTVGQGQMAQMTQIGQLLR